MSNKKVPFKVDIAGIIEIMGSSLYSRSDTPIRELIQNAHDAIARRKNQDLLYQGRIDIVQDAELGTITFSDDGIGLTPDEAENYLGTLGIGITGLLKGRATEELRASVSGSGDQLIGQFGVGLFSAFMLADQLVVESKKADHHEGVRWSAGAGTDIDLSTTDRQTPGTSVTLHLKKECLALSQDAALLENAIKRYAEFLPVPIFLNEGTARVNLINVAWFQATPDTESIENDIASYFGETPLDVIPVRTASPVAIEGVIYISPQRTPGFSDGAIVSATIRRMVISRRIQDLLPPWASFVRGILELPECAPTASREDLVRDDQFQLVRFTLNKLLYEHLEKLGQDFPRRLEAIINWHRFTIAGAALSEEPLRELLRSSYRFNTTDGELTYNEILQRSVADPIVESEHDFVIWYHADRRQERYLSELYAGVQNAICVHAVRSFEESLLAAMVGDSEEEVVDLRTASPSSPNFGESILNIQDVEEAAQPWQEFLNATDAKVMLASFRSTQPVMAFLNERYELAKTFEELKKEADIPSGFRRLIDAHFEQSAAEKNEVILNRTHSVVKAALTKGPQSPLANVVRLLVITALNSAGATISNQAHQCQSDDLDWIAELLRGRD